MSNAGLEDGIDTPFGPLSAGRLTVLTWNLWWRFGPWEARLPAIVETIRRLDPDICCLQEVWVDRAADESSAGVVARELDRSAEVAYRLEMSEGIAFGNAVVSRWPIGGHSVLELPSVEGSEEYRTCLRADVDSPFGTIQAFSTHLNWRFDESAVRQRQVRAICEFVAASPKREYPPILCGDFNAAADSDEIRMLTGRAAVPVDRLVFHDAWEVAGDTGGITWSNANPFARRDLEPDRRIDYVFVGWPKSGGRGHVEAVELVGVDEVDGIVPSDHYGVMATLRA